MNRRKILSAVSLSFIASLWTTPMVRAVLLPAHAQTSAVASATNQVLGDGSVSTIESSSASGASDTGVSNTVVGSDNRLVTDGATDIVQGTGNTLGTGEESNCDNEGSNSDGGSAGDEDGNNDNGNPGAVANEDCTGESSW